MFSHSQVPFVLGIKQISHPFTVDLHVTDLETSVTEYEFRCPCATMITILYLYNYRPCRGGIWSFIKCLTDTWLWWTRCCWLVFPMQFLLTIFMFALLKSGIQIKSLLNNITIFIIFTRDTVRETLRKVHWKPANPRVRSSSKEWGLQMPKQSETHLNWVGELLFVAAIIDFLK